jgi:transmembrane sensor
VKLKLPKTRGMLRREARAWLIRLQSGRDPGAERKFRDWYNADPAHAEAFEAVRRNFQRAGLLRESPASSDRRLLAEPGFVPAAPRFAWAAAAALALLVPAGWLLIRPGMPSGGTNAVMLVTRVGEIRRVGLADGSNITLDSASAVVVEIGRVHRRARVKRGRARFEIIAGREPFMVEAGTTNVSAKQATLDVESAVRQSRVDVLSGTADVQSSAGAASFERIVLAGESVTASADGIRQTNGLPARAQWARGMLQFAGTPLADAVELANRYSEQKIIAGADVGDLRVSGGFRAGDSAGLAKVLAAAFDLSLARTLDGNLLLSRKRPAAGQNKKGG